MSEKKIIIYTDGAAINNPGPGGYGAVLIWGTHRKEISQGYRLTTNNRMELMAVIAALESLKKTGHEVVIYSDSNYVVRAVMEGWLSNWIKKGFKKGNKQIKNKDLWMRIAALAQIYKLNFIWVKGHAENELNNLCDELATSAARSSHLLIDEGYENADEEEKQGNDLFD